MSLGINEAPRHHAVGVAQFIEVPRIPDLTRGDEEEDRSILAVASAQEGGFDFARCLLYARYAFTSLIVEVQQALAAQQFSVDRRELGAHAVFRKEMRVSPARPEVIGHSGGQRGAEARSQTTMSFAFEEVGVEAEERGGQNGMAEDRIKQFMPHLCRSKRVFKRAP